MTSPVNKSSSVFQVLIFWWLLFVIIQGVQRLFLLPGTARLEWPSFGLLAKTLGVGLIEDIIAATGAAAFAVGLGLVLSLTIFRLGKGVDGYRRALNAALVTVGCIMLLILIVDVGYYGFGQQRLDFVFFEYIDDLLHTSGNETGASQAAEQTAAELSEVKKWSMRIGGFLLLEALAFGGWIIVFKQKIAPMLTRWERQRLAFLSVTLAATVISGVAGLGPFDLSGAQTIALDSEAYFNLAQNPVLATGEPLRGAFLSRWSWTPRHTPAAMTFDEAVPVAQETLGQGAKFPFAQYPLVRESNDCGAVHFEKPVNVVLLFVEGLDRRYLDRTIDIPGQPESKPSLSSTAPSGRSIRLTPFLDRLKNDSLYFENFFSNGVATTRGLFSTLCSSYPRHGTAVIKTRYEHDYLCLPALLRRGGFITEMVVSLDSDIPGIRPFMARNGLDRLYGESDFPTTAERLGVGLTDSALFDFMQRRIEALQTAAQPFFLAALTSSTHHPFTVPLLNPEVEALRRHSDHYIAALRYFDLEFEKFMTSLQRDGLLRNSIVIVLGDHGRHEPVGETDVERQGGRFLVPLFIWFDDSLRAPKIYQPRRIERIASQVDLAPTILILNGLLPHVSPFVGRDLSCLFIGDCLSDNMAYLSSVYDDLIGLADHDGLWLYSFRRRSLKYIDLKLRGPASHPSLVRTDAELRYRRMLALYITSNTLLEQNRIWSWRELGKRL